MEASFSRAKAHIPPAANSPSSSSQVCGAQMPHPTKVASVTACLWARTLPEVEHGQQPRTGLLVVGIDCCACTCAGGSQGSNPKLGARLVGVDKKPAGNIFRPPPGFMDESGPILDMPETKDPQVRMHWNRYLPGQGPLTCQDKRYCSLQTCRELAHHG
jgi:hypothetical protein